MKKLLAIAAAVLLLAPLAGQEGLPAETPLSAASLPDDPALLLGMGLDEAWMAFGAPSRIYSLRGDEEWQDDVVFEYAQGFSLFWYGDRVWQIRMSKGYRGGFYGFSPGDAESALAGLGNPLAAQDGFLVFELPYRGFPSRLRARVVSGKIEEAYVYRADF